VGVSFRSVVKPEWVAEINEFTVFPLLYLHKFEKSALIAYYNDTTFWISAGTNKDFE